MVYLLKMVIFHGELLVITKGYPIGSNIVTSYERSQFIKGIKKGVFIQVSCSFPFYSIPLKDHINAPCLKSLIPHWEFVPALAVQCLTASGQLPDLVCAWSFLSVIWETTPPIWRLNHPRTGWWFGTFFIFPYIYIGNSHPNWLIFFRGVETTMTFMTFPSYWE